MSALNGWLYSVFAISLAAGIADIFAPVGATKKYVKYVVSLVTLIVIITPAVRAFSGIPQLLDGLQSLADGGENSVYTAAYDNTANALIKAGKEGIESKLKQYICERFLLSENGVSVIIEIDASDESDIKITEIEVRLSERSGIYDADRIAEYVKEITGCESVQAVYADEAS